MPTGYPPSLSESFLEDVPVPPLKPLQTIPVPPPIFPSATRPEDEVSSAWKASSGFTWNPLMSFSHPPHVSPTTGSDHQSPVASACPRLTRHFTTASRTTP